MIKNLVISPVVIGRISTGDVINSGENRLPTKIDYFRITKNSKVRGIWQDHPISEILEKQSGKLRSIPVRIMFDTPENNFQSSYAAFSSKGRRICTSNPDGLSASRVTQTLEMQNVECLGPDMCEFGLRYKCKQKARLMVSMESDFERDPLSGFAHRTSSFNTISAITSRLSQYHAINNGKLAGMECNLILRAKTTAASFNSLIYYVDLEPRKNLLESLQSSIIYHDKCEKNGINLQSLEDAVSAGLSRSQIQVENDETDNAFDDVNDQNLNDEVNTKELSVPKTKYPSLTSQSNNVKKINNNVDCSVKSKQLIEVMKHISTINDSPTIENARIWIKRLRNFSSDAEREEAYEILDQRLYQLTAKAA